MILCKFHGLWHSASKRTEGPGCSLSVGHGMPRAPGFEYYERPERWGLPRPDMSGITFYTKLFWGEHRVPLTPFRWHPDLAEPYLFCLAGLDTLGRGIPNRGRGWKSHPDWIAAQQEVEAGGFEYLIEKYGSKAWYKFIHVDDIIKVEGPPPEGSF